MLRKLRQRTLWHKSVLATIVLSLVAGLAYALLQTQGSVLGSTITTGNADLLISADGVHYGKSIPGFNFTNALPGGYATPAGGYPIYLKNNGSTALAMDLSINGTPSNPNSADLARINFNLIDAGGQATPQTFALETLIDGQKPLEADLAAGASREYKLQAALLPTADQGAAISGIDLVFTGTARDANDPNQPG